MGTTQTQSPVAYPYPASVRINQSGDIFFCAREAYVVGDSVILNGVIRASSRAPEIPDEDDNTDSGDQSLWFREESSRTEPLRNIVLSSAQGFSPPPSGRQVRHSRLSVSHS